MDKYLCMAQYDGRYRVDISRLQSGTTVESYIYDDIGETIGSDTYCISGDGIL